MSTDQKREELHHLIDQIEDEKVLEALYTLISNQIVAFSTQGHSLDLKTYEAMIREGEEDIITGKVHTLEEAKAHFKKKMND